MSEIEVYKEWCSPRFSKIEETQDKLSTDVGKIREKLFDGMGDAIDRMDESIKEMRSDQKQKKRSKAVWTRDIILTLLGSGGIVSLILMQVIGE